MGDIDLSPIRVSAVVLRDRRGRLLTVRKRGTDTFMLPGGKPENGEGPERAAVRECREELAVDLDTDRLQLVGVFRASAANEVGRVVEATVFEHPWIDVAVGVGEIEELRWLDPSAPTAPDLAPLLVEQVLPALTHRQSQLPRRVTVFTGSADGTDAEYARAVADLADALASHGVGIVYGGGRVGLMGRVADAALAAGGEVIGVMPEALVAREIAHQGLTCLDVVEDMHQRKLRMGELADAFVALPGGVGTLEELFEAWTWQQLGLHTKPVALYDVGGFWSPLVAMVDHMVSKGFLSPDLRAALIVASSPEELLEQLINWDAPPAKWRSPQS